MNEQRTELPNTDAYTRCAYVDRSEKDPGTVRWVPYVCGVTLKMHDRAAKGHDFVFPTEQPQDASDVAELIANVQSAFDLLIEDRCCGPEEINEAVDECDAIVATLRRSQQASGGPRETNPCFCHYEGKPPCPRHSDATVHPKTEPSILARRLHLFADTFEQTGEYEDAVTYLRDAAFALDHSEQAKWDAALLRALDAYEDVLQDCGDRERAIRKARAALNG